MRLGETRSNETTTKMQTGDVTEISDRLIFS